MSRSLIRTLVALLAGAALAVGLQAREGVDANPGLYRYAMAQSTASSDCPYDYVEMGAGGRSLALSSRPGAATDDGGAVLGLQVPMELYQSPIHALVVSGNGYLAAAGSWKKTTAATSATTANCRYWQTIFRRARTASMSTTTTCGPEPAAACARPISPPAHAPAKATARKPAP
ncbi:hypothetical protein [Arenimonas daejeonensis]|uniref:hypothetical protein n=1 Tax=Arenimonas daejeonensis TaxID=370777 RepID=UPI0011BDEEC1|nr:hypothetical protein [Arenimonas daejeonensis]